MSDEDIPGDVVSITRTDDRVAIIRSEFLNGRMDHGGSLPDFGVEVTQHGRSIGIASGTVHPQMDDSPSIYTWHDLTPEQAREIAAGLEEAAENAEVGSGSERSVGERKESFIGRVLGR